MKIERLKTGARKNLIFGNYFILCLFEANHKRLSGTAGLVGCLGMWRWGHGFETQCGENSPRPPLFPIFPCFWPDWAFPCMGPVSFSFLPPPSIFLTPFFCFSVPFYFFCLFYFYLVFISLVFKYLFYDICLNIFLNIKMLKNVYLNIRFKILICIVNIC